MPIISGSPVSRILDQPTADSSLRASDVEIIDSRRLVVRSVNSITKVTICAMIVLNSIRR